MVVLTVAALLVRVTRSSRRLRRRHRHGGDIDVCGRQPQQQLLHQDSVICSTQRHRLEKALLVSDTMLYSGYIGILATETIANRP